ncbi:small ribosomal subunit protein mS33 isoform X2 [Tamandua tetradactyla]|uniref:small ribosomal subunit protein mS33 isoform X2 n=1 Tax=Tamandua tetradactyla TaxID=48850 RepID=UPI0040538729
MGTESAEKKRQDPLIMAPRRRKRPSAGLQRLLFLAAQEMSSLSEYALRMTRLSARLFGEVARPTDSKSMKVVKLFSEQPLAKRKETYDWYPNHNTYFALMGILRFHGLYRDEHQDFKEEQMRLKKLRGKGKPKKGEGKRAAKRK